MLQKYDIITYGYIASIYISQSRLQVILVSYTSIIGTKVTSYDGND